MSQTHHALALGFGLALFGAALWVLHRQLAGVQLAEVLARFRALPLGALGPALLGTLASYLAMTGYDALALRYLGRSLPLPRIVLTSFIATAVGNNVGMAMLSAGAVRLRMYIAAGLSAREVVAVVAMAGLTFGIGVIGIAALVLILAPQEAAQLLHMPVALTRAAGLLVLVLLGSYLVWSRLHRTPLRVGSWQVQVPGVGIGIAQLVLAAADLGCAAAVLYVLLPGDIPLTYPALLSVYVLAIALGIASHVPGGLGVFDSLLLLALPAAPKDALLAAVLMYRLIYYLLPLLLAALLVLGHELYAYRGRGSVDLSASK